MRITGGLDRGRRLRAPRGASTRPTSAKVREAIFNILGPAPHGAVLDLFAGTGALGLEALSRGASSAVFVERDSSALAALRRNVADLKLGERTTVIGTEVHSGLRRLFSMPVQFRWVFLDPPYEMDTYPVLAELSGSALLAPCAIIVVEHDRRHRPPNSIGELFQTDRREYGETEVSFFRAGCS